MTRKIIPAGYRLNVSSWENDADNYKNMTLEGLTARRVEFLLSICRLFKSGSNNNGATFGNMYEPSSSEVLKAHTAVHEVASTFLDVLTKEELEMLNVKLENEDEDDYEGDEYADELIESLMGSSADYRFRVYDSATVEHIPHEIEVTEVTHLFNV